jgi:tRNA U38,U39,U40 pseudouridine synthase TruA
MVKHSSRIVTGDESWVFHYITESKAESSLSSQKEVQDSAVSRESDGCCWDVHGVLFSHHLVQQ